MRINKPQVTPGLNTHEGAVAYQPLSPEQKLRRSVMSCLLWEDSYYESGELIADRIARLAALLPFEVVADLAVEARERMKLRHAPLYLALQLASRKSGKAMGDLLARIIQRPDEMAEFLALYWMPGKKPLAKQIKRGLALAFQKFDEYQLAKYNREGKVRLRDVLFLCHAKPANAEQEAMWKRLVDDQLATPATWEVALSAGGDKKLTFESMLREKSLGALAFLRNLRNMLQADVDRKLIIDYFSTANFGRVLPFRFIAAAQYAKELEQYIEPAMLKCLSGTPRLAGKTAIVVDNSGSMYGINISARSEMDRSDAACALAILLREICEDVVVIGFATTASVIPARRGFALRDAIRSGPTGGTNTDDALNLAEQQGYDRIIVVTDEQSHQSIRKPLARGYFINVANYRNGIGYGDWVHIDGWSEAVVDYIQMSEASLAG